jgi:25S rRNA (adenine2142-N1)-methyltransferase
MYDLGRMLERARHFLCNKRGFLFLVLPLACVKNSRYCTEERLHHVTESLGYICVASHSSSSLVYHLYKVNDKVGLQSIPLVEYGKEELNPGPNRNNFHIVLKKSN